MHILYFGARSINTQSATKEARNVQSGTCEGSHLARSQSRPSGAALEPFCCCCCCCDTRKSQKRGGRQGGDNVSHSPRLNSRMHCLQHNSRLTSKKFSTYIEMSARAAERGRRPFVGAAWSRASCECHRQSDKRAQDVHLYWSHLATSLPAYSLGAGPSEPFVDPRPR